MITAYAILGGGRHSVVTLLTHYEQALLKPSGSGNFNLKLNINF